jgi:hypothetical protein
VLTPDPSAHTPAASGQLPAERVALVTPPPASDAGLYSTPAPNPAQSSIAPPASLANYVVAHSEFSGPISRRMALLGILASENGAVSAPPDAGDAAAETPDAQ